MSRRNRNLKPSWIALVAMTISPLRWNRMTWLRFGCPSTCSSASPRAIKAITPNETRVTLTAAGLSEKRQMAVAITLVARTIVIRLRNRLRLSSFRCTTTMSRYYNDFQLRARAKARQQPSSALRGRFCDQADRFRRLQLGCDRFNAEQVDGFVVVPAVTEDEVTADGDHEIAAACRQKNGAFDDRRTVHFLNHQAELLGGRVDAALRGL